MKMNDNDRTEWVDNDEGLYNWWRMSGLPKRKFVRTNREELDRCINKVLNGDKPAHYLAYGG